ncbi:hypothetical protein [Streptomyces sp. sk2.1]|uniref:hypothetical protein n=1 Tax=Streptomyces sp. sk2.1 TaxID=2478959 RepID=UPI0011E692BD|nr:hypothetical protein [Streptomyces sp. sk2.1]
MSILRPGGATREEHHEPCARVVPAEPEKAIAAAEPAQEPGHRVGDFLPLSLTGFPAPYPRGLHGLLRGSTSGGATSSSPPCRWRRGWD